MKRIFIAFLFCAFASLGYCGGSASDSGGLRYLNYTNTGNATVTVEVWYNGSHHSDKSVNPGQTSNCLTYVYPGNTAFLKVGGVVDYSDDSANPVPTPTPTPTPSPTPNPTDIAQTVTGDIGDPLPAGYAATVKIVFDDGEIRYADVNSQDGTYSFPFYNSDQGRHYKQDLYVYALDMESPENAPTPVSVMELESGTVPEDPVLPEEEPAIINASAPPAQFEIADVGNVVGSDGVVHPITQVSGGTIGTTTVVPSVSGPAVYSVNGAAIGTGTGGSFVAAPEAPQTNIDLTDIKNLLREGNIDRKAILARTHGAVNAITAPSPSPTPTPTPEPEEEETGSATSTFSMTGITGAETVEFTAPANGVDWELEMPGGVLTVDLNPEHQPWFVQLCAWLKLIIWWLLTIWITWHVYNRLNALIRDLFQTLESADIHRIAHSGKNKGGILGTVSFGLLNVSGFGFVKGIAISLVWKVGIIAAVALFVSLVGGQFLTFGGISNWFLGGSTLFGSLASVLVPGVPFIQTAVHLLCLMIPMDHVLNVGAIWLACEAVAGVITLGFAWFVRWLNS